MQHNGEEGHVREAPRAGVGAWEGGGEEGEEEKKDGQLPRWSGANRRAWSGEQ